MPRYFVEIKYDGTDFSGWQIQPNSPTIQETIEDALLKILKYKVDIVGCGRTDAGVHASQYFFHFDSNNPIDDKDHFLYKLNAIVKKDIAANRLIEVESDAHARYDATERSYQYFIHFKKNPFLRRSSFRYNYRGTPDLDVLNQAASVLLAYENFYPFCKSKSQVNHYRCKLYKSMWTIGTQNQYIYEVTANRFLRGMVRLLVGMCLNVSLGKLTLDQVREAMDNQKLLTPAWSVPPQGLFLSQIKYPYIQN